MRTRRIAILGLSLALGMILSYVELLFPLMPAIPGIKIGLANGLLLFLLYAYSWREAVLYSLARLLLTALLFGNIFSLVYAATGACVSLCGMLLIRRMKLLDVTGVSLCGGILHNLGQLAIAYAMVQHMAIFYYAPVLVASGALCGYFVGVLTRLLFRHRLIEK